MIAVSSILRRAVYPAMSRAGIFSRRLHSGEVCVLTYHGVLPEGSATGASPTEGTLVSAEQFRRQLRFLKSHYELITPEAFRGRWNDGASLPERAVLLTCDDGLLNVLTEMVPILLDRIGVGGADLRRASDQQTHAGGAGAHPQSETPRSRPRNRNHHPDEAQPPRAG